MDPGEIFYKVQTVIDPSEGYSEIPSMKAANRLVIQHWGRISREYGWTSDVTIPQFPDHLLFGVLSDDVHNPRNNLLLVKKSSSASYKCFFKSLADLFGTNIEEVDDIAAAAELFPNTVH